MGITEDLGLQIAEINNNPRFTARMKAEKIAALNGAPRQEMFDFVNKNFRTGPDLADEIAKIVSKDRQKSHPKKDK